MEIWVDIPNYEGKYQASNLGRIRSLDRKFIRSNGFKHKINGKILKQSLGSNKYLMVSLGRNTSDKKLVHRIIALCFCEKFKNKNHVDHINSIKTDNRCENLQWVTQQENNKKQNHSKGENRHNSVLTKKDIIHIRDEYNKLLNIRKYGAIQKIASGYNVNNATINDIVNKRTWKHV